MPIDLSSILFGLDSFEGGNIDGMVVNILV